MDRRRFLATAGVAAAASVAAWAVGSERRSARGATWREIDLAPIGDWTARGRALVQDVEGAPLLVALHGAGEAAKGPGGGSRGWRDDYGIDAALRRLRRPPLSRADFQGFVDPDRLTAINAGLASSSFAGLALACPFTPRMGDADSVDRWARVIEASLLPQTRATSGAPRPVGIDGVSMGGRIALLLGLGRPDLFDSVGALQPALDLTEVDAFADLAARAHARRPRPMRLVSSLADPYLEPTRALSVALSRRGVEHSLLVTPGPHDYPWNRGPGAIEMLLWHDRVLRGRPPV